MVGVKILNIPSGIFNILENMESKRKTSNFMTRYEYTKLISARAVQISNGGERGTPLVKIEGVFDPIEIAKAELKERVIPLKIVRNLPDGTVEEFSIDEINIRDY